MSLTNFDGCSSRWRWVGFRNYVELFARPGRLASLLRTLPTP